MDLGIYQVPEFPRVRRDADNDTADPSAGLRAGTTPGGNGRRVIGAEWDPVHPSPAPTPPKTLRRISVPEPPLL